MLLLMPKNLTAVIGRKGLRRWEGKASINTSKVLGRGNIRRITSHNKCGFVINGAVYRLGASAGSGVLD